MFPPARTARGPVPCTRLPRLLSVATTGAAGPRDMGKVMGWLSPKTRGRADGRVVSQMVGQALVKLAG